MNRLIVDSLSSESTAAGSEGSGTDQLTVRTSCGHFLTGLLLPLATFV
jgi:hypothetical protein